MVTTWEGLTIATDRWLERDAVVVIDKEIRIASNLAWVAASPPFLLDDTGKIRDLSQELVGAIARAVERPTPTPLWQLPPPRLAWV